MTRSFGTIRPPKRHTLTAKGQDKDAQGNILAEIEIEFQECDIPTAENAANFGYEQIRKYVEKDKRIQFPPQKGEADPVPFASGPSTGAINLTEQSVLDCALLTYMQIGEDPLPFHEFVFMRQTAPQCYMACQQVLRALIQGEDLEGNPLGGGGSESSPPVSEKTSAVIPISSTAPTVSASESTTA